jgi:hypothetical protein
LEKDRSRRPRCAENRSINASCRSAGMSCVNRHVLRKDAALAGCQAGQFPLDHGHLLDQRLFGAVSRIPVGFQIVAELVQ